jgi:hypothetical protein
VTRAANTLALLAIIGCGAAAPGDDGDARGAAVRGTTPGATAGAGTASMMAIAAANGATPAVMTAMGAPGSMPSGPGLMGTPNFDGQSSLQVFEQTLYPILRQHCAMCHSEPPEGRMQLPLHASSDPATAHMWALTKINLRQPEKSRLPQRQELEGHHCWSDCKANSAEILQATHVWADAVRASLPVSTLMVHQGEVTEQEVLGWINADKSKLAPGDAQYIKYASLHRIQNSGATPDDMNLARVGLSKILNSTSIGGPKIANPVAIDPYFLVYRFDTRDYWGFNNGGGANPSRANDIWARITKGNFNADDQTPGPNTFANKDTPANSMAKDTPTFPNIAGFYPDYVDAAQLGYTLSRPDVYADIMQLGTISPPLEVSLGVKENMVDDWKFVTVDDAITINHRMLLRQDTPFGYFWKGVDPFAQSPFIFYDRPIPEMDSFSLVKTTPVFGADGSYRMDNGIETDANGNLVGGVQAQASEMIFSLPNGMQGYFIGGGLNQIRVDAFPFIVFDPRRGGVDANSAVSGFRIGPGADLRLLTPASCMSCHMDGMNRTVDDMDTYINANPTKFDAATVARVRQLYFGNDGVKKQIEIDRDHYMKALQQILDNMIVGTTDKTVYFEPIEYLFESAQTIFDYQPSASN